MKILGFLAVASTRDDLFIYVSKFYYYKTDIDEARVISAQGKIKYRLKKKKVSMLEYS